MKVYYTEGAEYKGDYLFRVYYNQKGAAHINENPKETFCYDMFIKEGCGALRFEDIGTRGCAEHPQGIRDVWVRLLGHLKDLGHSVTFSNEIEHLPGVWLGSEFNGRDWFRRMVDRTSKEATS